MKPLINPLSPGLFGAGPGIGTFEFGLLFEPVERVEEAKHRIQEAAAHRLRSLSLRGLYLKALPQELGQMSDIRELDLSINQLTRLPSWLGRRKRLRELNLSQNLLTELPAWLKGLDHLKILSASNNQFGSFPEAILGLAHLEILLLDHCGLAEIPERIGALGSLKHLGLTSNRLRSLPDALQTLPLDSLGLENNPDLGLPPELLSPLVVPPQSIGEDLGIRHPLAGQRSARETAGAVGEGLETYLSLQAHAGSPARPILKYYFRSRKRRPLNEGKLILVGRGGVGKTCLVDRLLHDRFDPNQKETPGIAIHSWEVALVPECAIAPSPYEPGAIPGRSLTGEARHQKSPRQPEVRIPTPERVRLHVWDFGGQRILHGTHQFFLTERTIYLLVLSGREDRATQDAEYWLQLIKSFGGNSRVVIALNKQSEHTFDVNRGLLLEKYPFISGFVRTDCGDSKLGIDDLRKLIQRETDSLEHRKASFPEDWFTIKDRLATMTDNFLTLEQYQELCRSLGETDPESQKDLASYLHILGIALHYADDPRLHDTRVLKPTWVTDGIYTVLRAAQREKSGGVLRPRDLERALDPVQYPSSKHDFLLRLMERFQLCFRLPGREERFLVPELLEENQPDLQEILGQSGLGFRFQYEALPEGLLPRFIVQTHAHSEKRHELRWRTGVVLEREGCQAVVRADARERRVDVHITGFEPLRRGLLAVIRAAFYEQHLDLKGLVVHERVPVPGEPGITVSYSDLLKRELRGETDFFPENMDRPVSVRELLNGVEAEESRTFRRASPAGLDRRRRDIKFLFHVFLSHNSSDKPQVRELKRALTQRGLIVWLDEDELRPGRPWQELIEVGIQTSASMAVVVGRAGLGPWESEEGQAAISLAVHDGRPVIPVLLPGAPDQPKLPMSLNNRT